MHLLGFSEGLAVDAMADDVVGREALSLVQFGRLQHSQANIVLDANQGLADEAQPYRAGVVIHLLDVVGASEEGG